ncbi:MAG: LuxR C-terminal-related transcriptional regulator [Brevinematales bacterium]|nr:LuxR C-terminal-related transcriptional regulator [Brevinematales bacterium]
MKTYLLEMKDITKLNNNIRVLNNFNLCVKENEFHTVIADNESSIEAIIKILIGEISSSNYIGDIFINGNKETFNTIKDSERAGISVIHQKPKFVKEMSIWENVFLGSEFTKAGFIDKKKCISFTSKALEEVGLNINPNLKLENLTTFDQHKIEMARAIVKNLNIWILEDLIAVLSEREMDEFFELLKKIRKSYNLTFVYVGHKLKEILNITDMITFVRDGKTVFCEEAKNYYDDDAEMSMMLGKELTKNIFIDSFCESFNISKREKDILIMLLNGKNNREICSKLCISVNTIKTHISNIYQKTGVNNRIELLKLMLKFKEN